jgi:hypothetical protein
MLQKPVTPTADFTAFHPDYAGSLARQTRAMYRLVRFLNRLLISHE